jgi:hypothetical protein
MGKASGDALRVGFDRAVRPEFQRVPGWSDAGLFRYCDLDDAVQLTEFPATELIDLRDGPQRKCCPHAARSGVNLKRRAVFWSEVARRRGRAEFEWKMSN